MDGLFLLFLRLYFLLFIVFDENPHKAAVVWLCLSLEKLCLDFKKTQNPMDF